MTYKETLFFVAKCLTINHEEHNKTIVKDKLKADTVDWEAVVKVSTAHFVFPALYCNFKKADFLQYLPSDLVEYMIHITDLNRERNQQIITQAKEINELLLTNEITPIFLKGTGNLLEGLYEDIAERMVGDIDLIFKKTDIEKCDQILKKFNYYSNSLLLKSHRHLPRLIHENKIAAVEIHKELLIQKNADEFNYNYVKKDVQLIEGIHFLSYKNQLNLSIIAKQINDKGSHYKDISLRNAYDVFLLSKKTTAKSAFHDFINLKNPLNCFLASCYAVFNKPSSLEYVETNETKEYIDFFTRNIENDAQSRKFHKKTETKLFIKQRLAIIYKSIFDKDHRKWLVKRTTDKNWQHEKMVQLGLKKAKPTL
tara:strand:- start:72 stop:1175 length:1104 start_codon:yes stop_codon:yes gene_type:complete